MSRKEFSRVIVWFRRDLRVDDNTSLSEACEAYREVIPLFILDPTILQRPDIAPARLSFLVDALEDLNESLRARGGRLVIRRGGTPDALVQAALDFDADAVYFHEEYEPFGRQRDTAVVQQLTERGLQHKVFAGLTATVPGEIRSQSGNPYTVFTPYKKIWLETPMRMPQDAPANICVPVDITSEPLPSHDELKVSSGLIRERGGEVNGRLLLKNFLTDGLADYGNRRDVLADHGTSMLSPHLHFGSVSVNTLIDGVRNKQGAEAYTTELAWRDFYFQILYHFPRVENGAFRQELSDISWENDERLFDAWRNGQTGYPIVDAAMRQLNAESWMHNRGRMIVASFLTKDLLIDWRWGERYFMQKLVDGDLAANNGGWQWSAGTGTDSQPFFRIFNPVAQGEKFDTDGEYVRRYIPELKEVPTQFIHSPWKLSPLEQESCGCILGRHYPYPVVDHASQRLRALKMYRSVGEKN